MLTGRNTNLFYEPGMAHAVGKPVVILSQHEDDAPIDLKARRWLPCDADRPDELAERLSVAVRLVLRKDALTAGTPDADPAFSSAASPPYKF